MNIAQMLRKEEGQPELTDPTVAPFALGASFRPGFAKLLRR